MNFSYGDGNDFDAVKQSADELYQTIGSVPCPYFNNEKIAFNARGIRHLKFKSDEKARSREDQYARLKLLHLAPKVLKLSRTVQGVWHTRQFESQKTHSRWGRALKDVCFYEFMAVLENVRVKVIVKEVADGERYFWSIIPFWSLDLNNRRRILHSRDPERD